MIQITDDRYDGFAEGFAEGYKFKEKELEKYRWHDLRKNPEDLPEDEQDVLCVWWWPDDANGKPCIEYLVDHYKEHAKRWCTGSNNIIAWRYIEPFEEGDE